MHVVRTFCRSRVADGVVSMYQNLLTFSDAYSDLYQLLTNNFHHL